MADAIVSLVAEKLLNLLLEEATSLYKIRGQVEYMERELRRMQAFLQDAEERQRNNNRVAEWVRDVRDIAYDVEDIVETYILRVHHRRGQRRHGFRGFIKRVEYFPRQLTSYHNISGQIEDIKSRIAELSKSKDTYGIQASEQQVPPNVELWVRQRRERALQTDINVVVGFEKEVEKIARVLIDDRNKQRSVISIVGMGGSGKTTLARRVCDHDLVKNSFGLYRALANVSQTYEENKVFSGIAKVFIGKEKIKRMDAEELKDELFDSLKKQRYLIVLDDIWQREDWNILQSYFPDVENGSRLVVATRFESIANYVCSSLIPHKMRPLSDEESWDLFCKIVFPQEDVSAVCKSELEQLGKTSIERCDGLPLAVAVMAGFLSTKPRMPLAWQQVLQGLDWKSIPEGDVCIKTLALSYDNLPPYLKPCFLYISCFPKGHTISAHDLILFWIAEGLVSPQSEHGRSTLEDVAEQWLEELNDRCLLQNVVREFDGGRIDEFQIHDLLMDLCRKKARELNFFQTQQQDVDNERWSVPRRLALHPGEDNKGYSMTPEVFNSKLRTLHTFFRHSTSDVSLSLHCLLRAKLLKVINLEGAGCRELPTSIGDIFHLRLLSLRHNKLRSIPSTVGNLPNLQTLDLQENEEQIELPKSVWELSSMRHMLVDDTELPVGGGDKVKSVNLQTLVFVKAGGWIQMSLSAMTNLRTLGITKLSLDYHRAVEEALDNLRLLRVLSLDGDRVPRKAMALPKHEHLEVLALRGVVVGYSYTGEELPPNLCCLFLEGTQLDVDPLMLFGQLPHLKTLYLREDVYDGIELLCSAKSFPQLKKLNLEGLPSRIRCWTWKQTAMPLLDEVTIKDCDSLMVRAPHSDELKQVKINGMSVYEFLLDHIGARQKHRRELNKEAIN